MKKKYIIFISISFLLLFINSSWAFDDLILIDRGSDQNIFKITSEGQISAITNTVPWQRASSIAINGAGNFIVTVDIYSAYYNYDGVYKVTSGGAISPIAAGDPFTDPAGVVIDSNGNYIVVDQGYGPARIIKVTPQGQATVLFEGSPLLNPTDLAIDSSGNYIITDRSVRGIYSDFTGSVFYDENGAVYQFNPVTQELGIIRSSVDENGYIKMDDLLGHLAGIAIDQNGNYIIVVPPAHLESGDPVIPTGNASIIKISPNGEIINTINIPDIDNLISVPYGIAIDNNGDYIIADGVGVTSGSGRILRVTANGEISVIVASDLFSKPGDIALISSTITDDDDNNGTDGNDGDETDGDEGDGSENCFIRAMVPASGKGNQK